MGICLREPDRERGVTRSPRQRSRRHSRSAARRSQSYSACSSPVVEGSLSASEDEPPRSSLTDEQARAFTLPMDSAVDKAVDCWNRGCRIEGSFAFPCLRRFLHLVRHARSPSSVTSSEYLYGFGLDVPWRFHPIRRTEARLWSAPNAAATRASQGCREWDRTTTAPKTGEVTSPPGRRSAGFD